MSSCKTMKTSGLWTPWGLDFALRRQAADLMRLYHCGGRMRRRGTRAETSGSGPILQRPRRSLPAPYTPSIHSYHNFLRLRNLFPDLNPRALHEVLELCNGDLVRTIDNIIYTKQINNVYFKKMVVYENNSSFEPMVPPFPVQFQASVPPMGPSHNQYSSYPQPATAPLPPFEVLRNSIFGRGRPIPGQQLPSFPAMTEPNLQSAAPEHTSQNVNFASMAEMNLPDAASEHMSQNAWPLLGQQQSSFSTISEPNLSSVHLEHMSKVVSGSGSLLNAPVSSHMEVLQKEDGLRRSNRRRQLSRRYQESYDQLELTDEMEPEFLQLIQPKVRSMPTFDLNLQLATEDPNMRKLNKTSLSKLDFNGREDKQGVQMIAKQKQNSNDSDRYSSSCDSRMDVQEIGKPSIHPTKTMCKPKLKCSERDKEIMKFSELQCKPEGQHCVQMASGNCEPGMRPNNLKKHKLEMSNIHWEPDMEYKEPLKQNTQPTNVNCELQIGISDLEKQNSHLIKMQDVTDLSWDYIDSNHMDCCLVMNTNPESTMSDAEVKTETSLVSEHHST